MLPGRRRLMGLAQVEVTLDGMGIVLQGVRILRRPDELSHVEPPWYRHTDGDLVPAVVLPKSPSCTVPERQPGTISTRPSWRRRIYAFC